MGKEVTKGDGVSSPRGADEITGSDCNGALPLDRATFGAIRADVRPLIEQMENAKRWYTITPQYVFGEAC